MLISERHKFVFAANTKTASTSIEHVLAPFSDTVLDESPARKHLSLRALKSERPDIFTHERRHFFVFGVMRDPVEWIMSWYRYRSGNTVDAPLPENMSFEDFWHAADWNIRRADGSKFLQKDIFYDTDGTLLADAVLPFESLNEDFAKICDVLSIPFELPHQNVSRKKESTAELPDALRSQVMDYYAEDYALLGQLKHTNEAGYAKLEALHNSD